MAVYLTGPNGPVRYTQPLFFFRSHHIPTTSDEVVGICRYTQVLTDLGIGISLHRQFVLGFLISIHRFSQIENFLLRVLTK